MNELINWFINSFIHLSIYIFTYLSIYLFNCFLFANLFMYLFSRDIAISHPPPWPPKRGKKKPDYPILLPIPGNLWNIGRESQSETWRDLGFWSQTKPCALNVLHFVWLKKPLPETVRFCKTFSPYFPRDVVREATRKNLAGSSLPSPGLARSAKMSPVTQLCYM